MSPDPLRPPLRPQPLAVLPAAPAGPAPGAVGPVGYERPPARPVARWVVVALGLLLALQPVSTDLYLPALPRLRADFGGSMAVAQATLSALILSFGIGQLLAGPLADRFGRRPLLLVSLGTAVAAAFGAAQADQAAALIAWRVLQGAALAGCVVGARAMVRDLYEPQQGAQVMARALTLLGAIALLAPLTGGALAAHSGWRGALLACAVFAAVTLAVVGWKIPESLGQRNAHALRLQPMLAAWGQMLRHPSFRAWALLVTASYGGLFTFLAGSSFLYIQQFRWAPTAYGAVLAVSAAAYLLGTLLCRRWLRGLSPAQAVQRGAVFTAAGGLLMAAAAGSGLGGPLTVAAAQALFNVGHGVHQPCGQASVTGPFPLQAGAAAALAGFVLALTAFGIGQALPAVLRSGIWSGVALQAAWAALTVAAAWVLVRRLPQVVPHAARPA